MSFVMRSCLVRMQSLELDQQLLACFGMCGIQGNAVHRTHLLALGLVEMANTLGAQRGVDDVDLLSLRDSPVWAFRLADIAVDAIVGNDE